MIHNQNKIVFTRASHICARHTLEIRFFFLEFHQLSASSSSFFQILICHRSITFLMDIAAYSVWLFEHVWDVKTFVSLTGFFIFQPGLIVRLIRELRFISSDCVCIKIQELRMIVFLVLCHALKNGSEKDPDKIFKGFPPSCAVFTLFCFVYVSLYFLLTRSSHFKAD